MKVVCIDNTRGNSRHLDLGKVYDAIAVDHLGREFYIVQSRVYRNLIHRVDPLQGERDVWVGVECFTTIDEYRNKKLESIGI